MAIDRNPGTESEKPAAGSTSDTPISEGADASGSEVKTFLQKLGDAAVDSGGQVIRVADASGDLTGMLPVVDVPPNLLETQANVLGDHKTGPLDSLPAPLPKVEFVQTHLSPDAIALNADLVYQALTRKASTYRNTTANPDVETVKNILQNMEEVDRQQLEHVFEQKYGTSLRQAVKTFLRPGEAQVTVESILNSKNGMTNLAGNAQIALTVLETDPVRGLRLLRAAIGPLDAGQLATLQTKFLQDYGIELKDAIEASKGLNADQKAVLVGILPGMATLKPEVLRDLAVKAANAKDLGLLQTLLGGDPNPLRAALANDAPFQQLMLEKFGKKVPVNRRETKLVADPIANDILREGRISLATILKADTSTLFHFLDNPKNTDYVFSHATPKDQRDYLLGRDITKANRQPANDAEAEAKRVYDVLEAAIQSQADGPRQAILREQLLFGGKFLTSDLASMVKEKYGFGFFGGDYNVSDMLVHIERNLTKQQFDLLRNPNYKAEFARSLQSFLKPEEQARILALIDLKLTAGSDFDLSKSKMRPLETFINDYKASNSGSIKQFIERLESMSVDEAQRYKTDPAFKKTIDDFAEFLIYRGDSQAENSLPLIKSFLNQVAETGKPPVLTELDKLIKEWGYVQDDRWNGMSDAAIQAKKFQTIAQVELILKDPKHMATLRSIFNRLTNQEAGPVSREEEALTRSLNNILWQCGAGTNPFYNMMAEGYTTVGMAGRRPFDGETVSDKASTYTLITTLPKEQLDNWRYSLLFDYQRAILENVLTQSGTLTTADKLRVLVTQGGKLTDMSQDFANLSDVQFAQIEKEYLDKYKSDLKTDLRSSIPSRERMTPEQTALFETILSQNGKVFPIDRMQMLINGNGGKFQDYQSFFAELKPEDWTKLQTDYKQKYGLELKDAVLAAVTKNENLDLNHQVLIKHILNEGNGSPQLVDRLRAFILGDGGKFSDFKQLLKDLSLEQRQKLHDDYLRVFGKNLDNDFLNKVDKAYKIEYALVLSVTPRDGLNDFFLRMNQYAPMSVADGGDLALQRMLQVNEQILRQFNATMKDMPRPVQDAIAEYFSASFQNALDSNKKYAEFMTNVIMTAASVAAFIAFLPAGVSVTLARMITQEMARKLVVMAALSTSGAVGRPALLAAYEGQNFDSSPQSLLMNGSLGALEMLLSYPFGMGVLATKSTVALTATQATERLNGVMGKIAALSGKADDPLLESTRAEAYKLITEMGNYPDRKQMETLRDQVLGALVDKGDPLTKDLVAMATTISTVANDQATHQISDILTKINAIAPENTNAIAASRAEAWNALSSKAGMSPEAITQARMNILQALAAKQDPVAIAALKAIKSIDSLSTVSGNELADRLRERVFQSVRSIDVGAAEAVVQVQRQADQTLANLLIQKIDTQAATIASGDLQSLKTQALDALNSLTGLGNTPEIANLRNQLIEALAKAKDPAAQAALEVSSILERQANNSLDLATLSSFNQKMQQDSALLDAALNLLQKPKAELDGITSKLIADASTLPSNLAVPEITARAASATEQLSALTTPANAEIVQALKKQATDAIDALTAQGVDKTKLELDFYQALAKHDSSAAATVANLQQTAVHNATIKQVEDLLVSVQNASGNLTELATLRSNALEALVRLGDNPEALAMRARILSAFEQSQDPVTKVAIEAFASIKGLSNEEILAKEIMLALSHGSEQELQLIKLSAIKNRISSGTDTAETLRQQALSVINKLPAESQATERLQLLRQLEQKDPVSKSALQALESLEGLDPLTRSRFTQGILEALEQGNVNAIKSVQISSLTQKILSATGNETDLVSQALSVIASLGKDSSSTRIEFLKAIENKFAAAKSAREALERVVGSENETDLTVQILGALTSNNSDELARIQVNSIIANIERGGSELNAAREQFLEAIFKLPNQEQQAQRLLGLKALKDKGDPVAKAALELNDAFVKASENALDLVTLAKLRQGLPPDIDSALAVFGRNKSHFNSLSNSIAAASLDRLGTLDARGLTAHLSSLTEQIAASSADKELVVALQKELTTTLQTLATKIGDLGSGSFELATMRERAFASLETLSSSASKDEISALRTNILNALAAKDDPIAKFTLSVKNYFDNAATITAEDIAAIEKLDPTLRNEALSILGRTKQELDQLRLDTIARLSTVKPEMSIDEAIDAISAAAEKLRRLADASDPLRDSLRQQVTASIDSIVNDIKAGSTAISSDKRKQAFQLLDRLSEEGFSEAQEAALRSKVLEALANKEDATAKAAIAAFDALRGLDEHITFDRTTEILAALAKDNYLDLRHIQVDLIQTKILAGSGNANILRNQALEAISHLPAELQQAEKLKLLSAIADIDPIAKATLDVKNYFDIAANLTYDDVIAIEKLDPMLRTEALAILGRTKGEFEEIVNDSLARLSTVKQNLTIEESLDLINNSVANLQRYAEASAPVFDSLRQQVSASVDKIANDIRNGSAILLGDKRKDAFRLLDSLSENGFSDAQEAALRNKILEALAFKDDPTAKAAIAAFDAVRGLEDEVGLTTNILSALSRDSQLELRKIQIASTQIKILQAGTSEINALRNQALEAISHLPAEIQQSEKLKLLTAIADKDPIAKTSLSLKNYFDNSLSLSYDDIVVIEKLDPMLRTEALAILGRTRAEFDQIINESLNRLGTVKSDLTLDQSLDLINKSVADLQRYAGVSGPVSESLSRQVRASVDNIANDIRNGSATLLGEKRKDAFRLLDSLSEKGFSDADEAILRNKILEALASKDDPTAKAAIAAFDAIRGLEDEATQITNILSALTRDSQTDLRLIQIASIQDKILVAGSADVNAMRNQALEAISHLPAEIQQIEKLKLLTAIADKDPIAKAALGVKQYFDRATSLTYDDIAAIEKLDPTLSSQALSLLGRSKEEFEQIVSDSLTRLSTVKADLTLDQSLELINKSVADLQRFAGVSGPVSESLSRQVRASVDNIANDIRNGSATLLGEKRKDAFRLLDSLSEKGFSDADEAILRNKILEALAAKDDPTAKAAIAAFDAVRGLEDEATRITNILSALTKDSELELRNIQVASIQQKILADSGDLNFLRKQALEAISHMPSDVQQIERIKLLTAIADKDPIAKMALNVKNYFDNAASLSVEELSSIEKLDPIFRNEALSILGRTRQEFDQIVSDSLARISSVKPDLAFSDYISAITNTLNELKHSTGLSDPLREALERQVNASIEAIANNVRTGSGTLLAENRKEIFSLISNLTQHGFTDTQVATLRNKVLFALISKEDPTARAAVAAFEAVRGLEDEAARTINILTALSTDSQAELVQIQISALERKILSGTGDINSLRSDALKAISGLPENALQAERLRFLNAISDKDSVAKTVLSVKNYLDNAANLSIDDIAAIEKLDPTLRGEALAILGRTGQEFDQIVSSSLSRLTGIKPDLSIDEAMSAINTAIGDLGRLTDASPTLRDMLKQQVSTSIDAIINNIRHSAAAVLPDKRKEAFQLLDKLAQHGFGDTQVTGFRAKILEALAAKDDPTAQAAIAALEAMRGLPDEANLYSSMVAALARDSRTELRQIQISSIQDKILSGTGNINDLRQQALQAISELKGDMAQAELLKFLTSINDKDPIAKAALSVKNYFDNAANLSVDDLAAIEKLDPALRTQVLSILGRSELELNQVVSDTLLRISSVKSHLSIDEALDTISAAADKLKRLADASDPLRDSLRQQVSASVDSIVNDIRSGSAALLQGKRKEAFQILDKLSEEGFSDVQEATLRTKLLEALASKDDPTAKAAIAAFDAMRGLDQQVAFDRITQILAALAKDSPDDLRRVQVSIIQDKILAGSGDIEILRQKALEAISSLPLDARQAEQMRLLTAIADKDPFAKAAVTINKYLDNPLNLTIDDIAVMENLSPDLKQKVLSLIGRSQKEFDQVISDSLTRLAGIEPNLTFDEAINKINLTFEEMNRLAAASPSLQNALRQRVSASIETILKEIRTNSTELLAEQRTKAYKLLESLSDHGFSEAQEATLRNKIIEALADKKDPAAEFALAALNAIRGLEDEAARTANIFAALTKNNLSELKQIHISALEAKIFTGSENINALRTQALDILSQLPANMQQIERLKFLTAIAEKDNFAKTAIAVNELLSKNFDASFDLISLAKLRAEFKGQNLDDVLAALGRNKADLDAVTSRVASSYSDMLKGLDINGLSQKINSLTDQIVISAKDREIATVLQQRLTEAVDNLTRKMVELPANATNIAAIKDQINTALQTLKNHVGRIEYARIENVLRQSLAKFDQSIAAEVAANRSGAVLEQMKTAISKIKEFKGNDFVSVRQQGLTALKEMEGLVDAQTLAQARKDLLEALALKKDRFAENILKRDALKERIANGDFDAIVTLERDMKRSIESGVTNPQAINFLTAEADTIAELSAKVTRLRTANSALEKLTATSDQTLIAAAKKEATEALAAMKSHLNEATLTKLQTHLDQTIARFEKSVIPTVASVAEVEIKPAAQRLSELTTSIKTFKGNAKELTALRSEALKVLNEAEGAMDAAALNKLRKEVYEALAAQNDDFAVKALKRMALKEEAEKGKLNPLARMEQDLTKEIERVQARIAALERRKGAELDLLAEKQALLALQKEQAAAAALRKVLEVKVIPVAVAATVARVTAREIYAPNPEEPIKEVPSDLVPSAALMELARVRLGEGPWQSAERILASDGKQHTVAEVRALTRAIQATYLMDNGSSDMSGLPVNYFFVTPDNYGALINAVKDDNIKLILLGLAN